jgi:hypothetical protein
MALTRLLLAVGLAGAAAFAAAPDLALEEVSVLELRGALAGSRDVRWDGEHHLLFTCGLGVVRVPYRNGVLGEASVVVPEKGEGGIVIAQHLAASSEYLAVASPMSEMLWLERGGSGAGRLGSWQSADGGGISFFESIDLQGSRLAILGLMRSPAGMSPDGAVAWTADLGKAPVKLQPLAYSSAGKGARPFDACAAFGIGKVRLLNDGQILLAPGAEPGILLYSAEGKLERAWDTTRMGIDVRCDFGDAQLLIYGSDDGARRRFLAEMTVIDELFETALGPAALVRHPVGAGPRWSLFLLGADGVGDEIRFPWTSAEKNAEIAGDVRGDRLIMIQNVYHPGKGSRDARLIEARLVSKRPQVGE